MRKTIILLWSFIMLFAFLLGCVDNSAANPVQGAGTETLAVRFVKGPSALGAVKILEKSDQYESVEVVASADEMVPKFISGEVDVAAVPTNLASVLYHRTEGNTCVVAVNTLGMLYILSSDTSITAIADLKHKTIVTAGQGAVPEYVLRNLLRANGLIPGVDVTIEYKAEHAEVASLSVAEQAPIVLLPEPFVTSVLNQSENIKIAVDLTEAWQSVYGDVPLVMGCIVVKKDISSAALAAFLNEYQASTFFANNNITETAQTIGSLGIMPEEVVCSALPRCHVVCLTGEEMKASMVSFLTALLEEDPKSIGGQLPGDDFYYNGQ